MTTMAERKRQLPILSWRYFDTLRGDVPSLLLLVLQAPLIGYFCALVWGSVEKDTPSLYFVLSLSAMWFGCITACREVVKERAIVERERFFGLSISAYIGSKIVVLSCIGAVQVLLLDGVVEWHLNLKGSMPIQLFALWLASMSGVGLGLLVSAVASTQERAVFAVPLLILPQILFSELAIPKEYFSDVVATVEKGMPVRWAFQVFQELAKKEPSAMNVVLDFSVLIAFALVLGALATLVLQRRQEA
ncbi:MAG: ABC transporter permease [Deltaproteobacteria bacterium]|nr:ABC transporter permease [Deltaproteobacteria bacterium]